MRKGLCKKYPHKSTYLTKKEAARELLKAMKMRDGRPKATTFKRCSKLEGGCGYFHFTKMSRQTYKMVKKHHEARSVEVL